MTLRNARGGDVQDVFKEVDDLLDSDDALIGTLRWPSNGELHPRVRSVAEPTRAAQRRD